MITTVPKSSMTRSYGVSATARKQAEAAQFQKWLTRMAMQNKAAMIFELEVWIRCLDRFFRIRNHPLSESELREVVRRDFSEELKIVRSVNLRMSQLCTEIVSADRTDQDFFGHYVENEILHSDVTLRLEKQQHSPSTPEDSLSLLIESLADLRPILDGVCQLPLVSFQAFSSIGKLISRELQRIPHLAPLLSNKFKPEFDRIEHPEITAIIKGIADPELRQMLAQVFLEAFRMLRYLALIGDDLRDDRPLKQSLLIFSLIYSELRSLMEFIDHRVLLSSCLDEERRDVIDGCGYALRMELDKVFGNELIGLVQLRQAPSIYTKVENAHGLLRNCLQQTIVGIAVAFNPKLTGVEVFSDFKTFLDQSKQLRSELWRLIMHLRYCETNVEQCRENGLIEELVRFREGAMRFLMFRDWEHLEFMHDEILNAINDEELRKLIHRFATYLETLMGQVNARAVLSPYPFDYPEVEISILPTAQYLSV